MHIEMNEADRDTMREHNAGEANRLEFRGDGNGIGRMAR